MSEHYGFNFLREENIEEYGITARIYQHAATGAELLSLIAPDENKVFGITFRTPPSDSTGIAHILEHSVFCGSKKYPVKEPFVELLKGSLQTFLNAFTYPDKTCYPVASQNLKDFYNLIDIYMDAVLHPLLDRHTFEQEGWHFELDEEGGNPAFKGVVFNEMKGVYASADNLLAEHSQRVLYPTTTYGLDSGGDPKHIPDLTWEDLKAFHKKFYHPSNARMFFYGDDNPDDRLRIMDEYLREYGSVRVDSSIRLEDTNVPLPRDLTRFYQAGSEDDDAGTYITVNWRLPEITDPETAMGLYLLDQLLTDTSASPLKKSLIDSGLGEDIAGVGIETQIRQYYYSIGMKGVRREDEDKVVVLIETTLRDLAASGIAPRAIEAALNAEEFNFRELNTGNYPRGLSLMITALQTWLYDRDPLEAIRFEQPLSAIRKRIASGEKYFESLIDQYLLSNPHRTILRLRPDAELKSRLDAEEQAALSAAKASWDYDQTKRMIEQTRLLKERQSKPDSPEALATIPMLSRSDLPAQNKVIPCDAGELDGVPFLYHDIQTQGITYLDVGFDLQAVPDNLIPLIPLWSRALLETGTAEEDHVSLTQRIGTHTGGIEPEYFTSSICHSNNPAAWVFLRGKSLNDKLPELLRIYQDFIAGAQLDNRDRIRQIIAEDKAELESSLIPGGHRFVSLRVRAQFNMADWIQEQLTGISALQTIRTLQKNAEENWADLKDRLSTLHAILTNKENVMVNLTTRHASRSPAERAITAFLSHLDRDDVVQASRTRFGEHRLSAPEGFIIPSQVNYVAKGMNLHQAGARTNGSALVVNRYLRSGWLWDQIRVQGGAYGGFSSFDHRSGQITLASYRDPNIARTLEVYDRTADYLLHHALDAAELDRAIIGTIGDVDTYLLPDAKGYASLCRHLCGETDEMRQRIREEILHTSVEDFQRFGEQLKTFVTEGHVVVLGSEKMKHDVESINASNLL